MPFSGWTLSYPGNMCRCMKDGKLVEQGTHKELIEKDGEYCKLHRIQAQAFTEEVGYAHITSPFLFGG